MWGLLTFARSHAQTPDAVHPLRQRDLHHALHVPVLRRLKEQGLGPAGRPALRQQPAERVERRGVRRCGDGEVEPPNRPVPGLLDALAGGAHGAGAPHTVGGADVGGGDVRGESGGVRDGSGDAEIAEKERG